MLVNCCERLQPKTGQKREKSSWFAPKAINRDQ
jgi:hypothetical protein